MKKVLIIDDDRELGWLLGRSIQSLSGIGAHHALSAEEGLQIIETQLPDLLIIDPMLTGMHGFELLLKLKENAQTAHLPVILMISYSIEVPEDIMPNIHASYRKATLDVSALLKSVQDVLALSNGADSELSPANLTP